MTKDLLIVFVKNIKLGKVKTRLAKTIGDENAFKIYKALVEITEKATQNLRVDNRIYFSDIIVNSKWQGSKKYVQVGGDLGERMKNAFKTGFEDGYQRIVLIGSDLPTISDKIITNAFKELEENSVVFGPAEDGGYYLIGLTKLYGTIFTNKPWSKDNLLKITLAELQSNKINVSLIETLNDIDTFEDLKQFPELLKSIAKNKY